MASALCNRALALAGAPTDSNGDISRVLKQARLAAGSEAQTFFGLRPGDAAFFFEGFFGQGQVDAIFDGFEEFQVADRHENGDTLAMAINRNPLAGIGDGVERVGYLLAKFTGVE